MRVYCIYKWANIYNVWFQEKMSMHSRKCALIIATNAIANLRVHVYVAIFWLSSAFLKFQICFIWSVCFIPVYITNAQMNMRICCFTCQLRWWLMWVYFNAWISWLHSLRGILLGKAEGVLSRIKPKATEKSVSNAGTQRQLVVLEVKATTN